MNWRWRGAILAALTVSLSACATVPQTAEQGVTDIKGITSAIECELAAVAMDSRFRDRQLSKWKSLTDVDLTLGTSIGANATGWISWPLGPALVTVNPGLGANRKDTSTSHVQFVIPIGYAADTFGKTCSGPDPSETKMGLAEWFRATLIAIDKRAITGLTFTKEFVISANASTRFGYIVTPTVEATDKGGALSYDRTSRITIALAPPPPGAPPPMAVYVVDEPEFMKKQRLELEKAHGQQHGKPAREHAIHDQTLQNLLLRKAPIKLAQ
jgi:hypothetical protein